MPIAFRYGAIGQRAAELARAHEMRVIAVRRNTQLSQDEVKQGLLVSAAAAATNRTQPTATTGHCRQQSMVGTRCSSSAVMYSWIIMIS